MKLTVCCFIVLFAVLLCESEAKSKVKSKTIKAIKKSTLSGGNDIKNKIRKLKTKSASQMDRSVGNSIFRVDKKGGTCTVKRKNQITTLRIKKIVERHENNTEVSFPLKDADFDITKDRNSSQYGIGAVNIDIKVRLSNNANISLQMFMFTESGNVTGEDGFVYEMVKGGTKINLNIEWPTNGSKIDICLGIKCADFKGKISKVLQKTRGMKGMKRALIDCIVCPNTKMTFSPMYRDNDTFVEMDHEFPLATEPTDGENIIQLRFKGRNIFYDPTMETGEDIVTGMDYEDTSSAQSSKYATNTLIFFFGLASFFNLFKTA